MSTSLLLAAPAGSRSFRAVRSDSPVCGAGHAVCAAAEQRLCLVKHQDGVHGACLLLDPTKFSSSTPKPSPQFERTINTVSVDIDSSQRYQANFRACLTSCCAACSPGRARQCSSACRRPTSTPARRSSRAGMHRNAQSGPLTEQVAAVGAEQEAGAAPQSCRWLRHTFRGLPVSKPIASAARVLPVPEGKAHKM